MKYVSCSPASSSKTSRTCLCCVRSFTGKLHHVCVCAHSAPESNTASSSLRSGNFKTSFSWAVGLGKNVNVISQTVRTCMQIQCTHEAPFTARLSSVPQPQLSASTRHSGTRSWRHGSGCGILADLHYRAPTRQRACVRARTQWRWTQNTVTLPSPDPSLIVMTFRRLSSRRWLHSWETFACLKRAFVVLCKLQVVLHACPRQVVLVRKPRLTASRCWTSNGVCLQKRRPKASTDDRPNTRKLPL